MGLWPETCVTYPGPKLQPSSPSAPHFASLIIPTQSKYPNLHGLSPWPSLGPNYAQPNFTAQSKVYPNSTQPLINLTHSPISREFLSMNSGDLWPNRGTISSVASVSHPSRECPYWHLSNDEFRIKIEKWLCFRYDKKYHPDHHYKNWQFGVMITSEGEEKEEVNPESDGTKVNLEEKEMELAL